MSPFVHVAVASLLAVAVAACSSAPAAYEPAPPPQRAPDAKTQLENDGYPPPPLGPRY